MSQGVWVVEVNEAKKWIVDQAFTSKTAAEHECELKQKAFTNRKYRVKEYVRKTSR
jgi:hypothetical protein